MTGTCKDCKWWSKGWKNDSLNYYKIEHGLCSHKSHEIWKFTQHHETSFCVGKCEEGHIADADLTGPDFGCIHHEPKEQEDG